MALAQVTELLSGLRLQDEELRDHALVGLMTLIQEHIEAESDEILPKTIPLLARLRSTCPYESVRDGLTAFLDYAAAVSTCPKLRAEPADPPYQEYKVTVPGLQTSPAEFLPPECCTLPSAATELLSEIYEREFQAHGDIDNMVLTTSPHPTYLLRMLRTRDNIFIEPGPLSPAWRWYIAIIAAARHSAGYWICHFRTNFLQAGGDPAWLGAEAETAVPEKLRSLWRINAMLAHQPWAITPELFRPLVDGAASWTMAELMHAVVIMAFVYSQCCVTEALSVAVEETVDTSGVYHQSVLTGLAAAALEGDKEADQMLHMLFEPASKVNGARQARQAKPLVGTTAEEVARLPRYQSTPAEAVEAGCTSGEPVPVPSQGVATAGATSVTPSGSTAGCGGGPSGTATDTAAGEMQPRPGTGPEAIVSGTTDAAGTASSGEVGGRGGGKQKDKDKDKSKKTVYEARLGRAREVWEREFARFCGGPECGPVQYASRDTKGGGGSASDFKWDEHAQALMGRFLPNITACLHDQLHHMLDLTYHTYSTLLEPTDTSVYRRAIWGYVQTLFGIPQTQERVRWNNCLSIVLKTFVKMVACFPEIVIGPDVSSFSTELRTAERIHVVLLCADSRLQATLLHALRNLMPLH